MNTHTTHDGVIESIYDDDNIERTCPEPTPENTGNAAYSTAIMKAFRRAKKAGKKNDARSRKIVTELAKERKKKSKKSAKSKRTKRIQKRLGDF